ncbi:MAG: YybH family protein [Pirellulales bacterium]
MLIKLTRALLFTALLLLPAGRSNGAQENGAANETADETADETAETAAEDPIHDELRAMRDGLLEAANALDLDGIVSYCDDEISLTTPDAVLSKGKDAVREYFYAKAKGPDRVVEQFHSTPTVDALSTLYGGDTAVATGTSVDHFTLTNGLEFDLNSRWSATLVKRDGQWRLANYHTATDVFDNPLLRTAKRWLWWAAGGGLLVGVLVGFLLGRRRRKPSQV